MSHVRYNRLLVVMLEWKGEGAGSKVCVCAQKLEVRIVRRYGGDLETTSYLSRNYNNII